MRFIQFVDRDCGSRTAYDRMALGYESFGHRTTEPLANTGNQNSTCQDDHPCPVFKDTLALFAISKCNGGVATCPPAITSAVRTPHYLFMSTDSTDSATVAPPRLLPAVSLPPYAFVSGKFPHPLRDDDGHGEPDLNQSVRWGGPAKWQDCTLFLRGIDLFNHGYYWEAHETWELLWTAAGREDCHADFFKVLIKLAISALKARENRPNGVRRQATAARDLLDDIRPILVGSGDVYMGTSLTELRRHADWLAQHCDDISQNCNSRVRIVVPFVLATIVQ